MGKRRGRSRDKVRRFLKWLETRQQIRQQKDSTTTVITVEKYEMYQGNDTADKTTEKHQKNIKQTSNDTQHKNDNNEEERKEDNITETNLLEIKEYCEKNKDKIFAYLLNSFIIL
jgi:hypothetical protein